MICLENFDEGVELTEIPNCGHFYHNECFGSWIKYIIEKREKKCPLCQKKI